MEREKKNVIWAMVISVALVVLVAGLGTLFVQLGDSWFNGLTKPNEWIPNFVIPLVWSVIYLTFAVILVLWIKKENLPRKVIWLLGINGFFNVLWCLVFFTFNQLFLGNVILIFNLILAVKLIMEVYKTQKIFSAILLLYPAWLCVATSLNVAVWILN